MSVFVKLRRSRQAAKEHQARMAEQKKKEEVKEPYRHVPTHAAIDAISCAPPTWRVDDRNRILEQNRRRSAMSAVGMGMTGPGMFATGAANHPGMIRASSSLSHVSYPSVYANPVVSSMPRSYSYSGGVHATGGAGPSSRGMYHQPWLGRQSVMHVPMPVDETDAPPSPRGGMGTSSKLSSSKGKEVERVHTDDSGVTSQASSKRNSPVASPSGSSSSEDELEMKPVRRSGRRPQSTTPVGLASSTYDGPSEQSSHHRLHPIQSRRISDSQQQLSRSTGTFSPAGARQSPVGRAYTTPAVPPPVPANLGNAIAGTAAATAAPVMPTFGPAASRSSASSAASGSTAPTSYASSLADQGRRVTSSPKMEPLSRQTTPPQTSSPEEAQHENQTTPTQSKPRILPGPARRASKTTRFVELETFTSQFDSTFELPELRPIDSSSSSGGLRKFKSSGSLQPSMLPPPHLQQSDLPQRQHTPTPAEQQLDGSPTSTATARRPSWTAASSPIVPAAPMPAPAMVPIVSSHPPPPPEPASSERAQSKQPSSSATVTTPPPSRGKLQKKRSEKDLAKQNSREEKQKDDSKKAPVAKKSSRWSLFKSGGQTAAVAG